MNQGHNILAGLVALPVLLLLAVLFFSTGQRPSSAYVFPPETAIYLTDLALFCEAPHTRHPLLSDLQSAYREGPGALEHSISSLFIPNFQTEKRP
ncbi:MAG: hypothetical protein CSA21_06135 [Deltaproteobacteria bacterium]|nr:MAG: hypothetical protein CSA21_06135 [Deltaproteobacteria bacterium]